MAELGREIVDPARKQRLDAHAPAAAGGIGKFAQRPHASDVLTTFHLVHAVEQHYQPVFRGQQGHQLTQPGMVLRYACQDQMADFARLAVRLKFQVLAQRNVYRDAQGIAVSALAPRPGCPHNGR